MGKLKRQIINKIRECQSEEDVIGEYQKYVGEITKEIRKTGVEDKEGKIRGVLEVAEEAARRVSDPEGRDLLSTTAKKLGKTEVMILPAYEDEFRGSRRWMKKDSKRFGEYVRRICRAMTSLAEERIDNKFTVYDLYRRVPEASFLIRPLLKQLKRMELVGFEYLRIEKMDEKFDLEMIHLGDKWLSASDITSEVIDRLEDSGKIPYQAIQRGQYVEW